MAIAWFICGYKVRPEMPNMRYCVMDDFTDKIITQDGGNWSESEVLGGYAVVKVKASDETLTAITKTAGFVRIPKATALDDALSVLNPAESTVLKDTILAMGYTSAELTSSLTVDIRTKTLGDVLRFAAQRRLKPRWDEANQQIVLDSAYQSCKPISIVDAAVQ